MVARQRCKKLLLILLLAISYWLAIAALPAFHALDLPDYHLPLPGFDLTAPQSPLLDPALPISTVV
ncbi:MAG: hypothetical protein KDJ52_21830 [Anaerolineae bacterium]|nr:hypothetical protein [Anaerolineae bacterium]